MDDVVVEHSVMVEGSAPGRVAPPREEGVASGAQASSSDVRETPTRVEEQDPRRGTDEAGGEDVGKRLVQELRRFGARVGPSIGNLSCGCVGSGDHGEISSVIVSEVFCKNRFTSQAKQNGLHPGYALDLTTGWDLNDAVQVKKAFELQETVRPYLLVGSPECAPWSQLMHFGMSQD
eukprot:6479398-Amphidinium_carterae.1